MIERDRHKLRKGEPLFWAGSEAIAEDLGQALSIRCSSHNWAVIFIFGNKILTINVAKG